MKSRLSFEEMREVADLLAWDEHRRTKEILPARIAFAAGRILIVVRARLGKLGNAPRPGLVARPSRSGARSGGKRRAR